MCCLLSVSRVLLADVQNLVSPLHCACTQGKADIVK
jgi:hypothetical protein